MKRRLTVTEIDTAKVKFVSLVKRGANQTPFKILKADESEGEPMKRNLLQKLFSGAVAVAAGPQGILIQKAGNFANAAEVANAFGFDQVTEDEGALVYHKSGSVTDPNKVALVQVNDNAHLIIKAEDSLPCDGETLKKSFFGGFNGTLEFNEAQQRHSLLPNVDAAFSALGTVIFNALDEDDIDHKTVIKTAVAEFAEFMEQMVDDLPESLLKMARQLDRTLVSEEPAGTVVRKDEVEGEADADEGSDGADAAAEEISDAAEGAEIEDVTGEEDAGVEDVAAMESAEGEEAPSMIEQFQSIVDNAVGGLKDNFDAAMESVNTTLEGLAGRVEATETLAKTLNESVEGKAVMSGDQEDEDEGERKPKVNMAKGEHEPGLFNNVLKFQ